MVIMAVIPKRKQIQPQTISAFLGLNENPDGQYNLKFGEASRILNFRITKEMQLKKREGFSKVFDLTSGSIRGMWYGEIDGTAFFLFAHGGHLYSGNLNTGIKTDFGTLTDSPTKFFYFGEKVYIINGYEYKSFDGTTLVDVAGYRPKIAIGTPPAGGGTLFEELNNLTGAKHQTFSADGIAIVYQIAETHIDNLDFLKVNGDEYTVDVNFKFDKITGKLNTAPYDLPLGDSTTQIDITKISGKKYRYTWDGTGTNPVFDSNLTINDYVNITCEGFNDCNKGVFKVVTVNTNYFEVINKNGKAENDKIYGKGCIYKRQILGDSSTRIDISNTTGTIYRYTWDSTGTNPYFETKLAVNDWVFINAENFSAGNNGVYQITAIGTHYFEVVNEEGVVESDKTMGTGGIYKCTCSGEPIGIVDVGEDNIDIGWTKIDVLGDLETKITISNPSGSTFRYTRVEGTDPEFKNNLVIGDYVKIAGQNFNAANNGVFAVTGLGTSYFEITNASGVAEAEKKIGNGYIGISDSAGNLIGTRNNVLRNKYFSVFGGANDTRIFIYGNPKKKNRLIYSGLADGIPSVEYFPANGYRDIGSSQFAVTGLTRQYDRAIVYTEKDAWYTYYDTITTNGKTIVDFPVFSLNSVKGNVASGQVQLINNNPFSVYQGVQQWNSSNVRDERNAVDISKRVQPSLNTVDLTTAITHDWEEMQEYWLCVGSTVWVFNYGNGTWYKFDNIPASCFLTIDGEMYFGTTGGLINKFNENEYCDNRTVINAVWEMGFYDFEAEWMTKYMNNIWVSIKPEVKSRVTLQPVTDNDGPGEEQEIYFNLITFNHCSFNNFSFNTDYNPKPFYVEVQAMGFCYFRMVLTNDSLTDKATVLSINLPARMGGKVR
jgi:hypothetical protein